MSIQVIVRCDRCGYQDPYSRTDMRYCPDCSSPFNHNQAGNMFPATAQSNPLLNPSHITAGDVLARSSGQHIGGTLREQANRMYTVLDEVNRGNALWELLGKNYSAYKISRKINEVAERIADIQLESIVALEGAKITQLTDVAIKTNALDVYQELEVKQAMHTDELKRLELGLSINRLGDALEAFNNKFDSETFADLPDSVKEKTFQQIYDHIVDSVFGVEEAVEGLRDLNGTLLPDDFTQ